MCGTHLLRTVDQELRGALSGERIRGNCVVFNSLKSFTRNSSGLYSVVSEGITRKTNHVKQSILSKIVIPCEPLDFSLQQKTVSLANCEFLITSSGSSRHVKGRVGQMEATKQESLTLYFSCIYPYSYKHPCHLFIHSSLPPSCDLNANVVTTHWLSSSSY